MQKIDSIIFDLDGTLWDSVDSVVKVWNEVLADVGFEPIMDYKKLSGCMGMLIDQIIKELFPTATNEQAEMIMSECLKREQSMLSKLGGKLYPSVEDTLSVLFDKYKLFIVSNCQNGYIQAFFKAHGLKKYFVDYECAGRTGMCKGDNIKLIIERNRLQSAVYVGDTVLDYEAACHADIPFVFAEYGFGNCEKYDLKLERFSDLNGIF